MPIFMPLWAKFQLLSVVGIFYINISNAFIPVSKSYVYVMARLLLFANGLSVKTQQKWTQEKVLDK